MTNLLSAIRPMAWDFFPTIAFAILTALHLDVRIATAAALGVGLAQVLVVKALGRPVPPLQWAGLGLAVVFGAAGVLTRDPRFLMAKPTIIYLAIAAVMLKPGWMLRYVPEIVREHGRGLTIAWGYAWAGMMALTGLANLGVAVWAPQDWPMFLAVAPLWSKLMLFAIQYASMRLVLTGRIRAARQAAA